MSVFNAGLPQVASTAGLPIGSTVLMTYLGPIVTIGAQQWLLTGLAASASAYPDAAKEPSLKIASMTEHARTAGNQVRQIATDGNGTFVAVDGNSSGYVYTTTDGGATWTIPAPIAYPIVGVAYGGGRFMVIANDTGTIRTGWSTNGTSWTTGPSQAGTGFTADSGTIAYGNGVFAGMVGGALSSAAFTSVNGTSLTAVTPGGAGSATSPQMAWNGSGFLVTSSNSSPFFRSTNGSSWTSFTPPDTRATSVACYTAGANGVFAYLTQSSILYRSTNDGVTWSVASRPIDNATIYGIFSGNNQFVTYNRANGIGAGKTVWVSSDFLNWNTLRFDKTFADTSAVVTALGYDGTRVVTLSDTTGYYATNVNQVAFVGQVDIGSTGTNLYAYVRIK